MMAAPAASTGSSNGAKAIPTPAAANTADAHEQSVLADLGGSLAQLLVASGDGQAVRH